MLTNVAFISSNWENVLAANLHRSTRTCVAAETIVYPMNREFQIRFIAVFLVLLTAAAMTLAWINFRKESQFVAPYDGVWWREHGANLVADRVDPHGPGAHAGVEVGEVKTIGAATAQLYYDRAWSQPTYTLERGTYTFEASPVLQPAQRPSNDWLRFIALIYLGIGLYVLFRRWTAPGSTHFYIFCVVSFVFYAFKYTGKLNSFECTIY